MALAIDGMNFNLNSTMQMQEFLYDRMGLTPIKARNEKGNISVAEEVLTHYAEKEGIKFCQLLINYRKLFKAKGTYIDGIKRKVSLKDCLLHPEFWLTFVETYRSSSTDPNFQNIPKHGDIIPDFPWKNIRKMFASLGCGWIIGEVDYIGAEVKIAAMLTDDPVLIDDLNNDFDMHSYFASVLFGIDKELADIKENHPEERFLAKNNFTFANLFGAGHMSIAEEMRKSDFYHDYVQAIWQDEGEKGSFNKYFIDYSEQHIEGCQAAFYERYKGVKAWQDNLIGFYYANGYIENPFGFRRRYPLKSTEIINYPIQSTSFLILLDALIRLDDALLEYEFQSHICGQIHDSGFFNIFEEETFDLIDLSQEIICAAPFKWAKKVPLAIEWEFGHNWLNMEAPKETRRNLFEKPTIFDKVKIGDKFVYPGKRNLLRTYTKVSPLMATFNQRDQPFMYDCAVMAA